MEKTFITVPIEDKHIGEPHVCFTENGVLYFGKVWLDNTRCKWYCEVDEDVQPYVTHILEEVTLPSQEEILSTSTGWREETKQECYLEGVEYILNKLKKWKI